MFVADADDIACAADLSAFKQAYGRYLTGMSQESYWAHHSPLGGVTQRLRDADRVFRSGIHRTASKAVYLKSDKVLTLCMIAGAIALVGSTIYSLWAEGREIARKRAVLTDRLDEALKRISKPGFNITREDGTASSFGRLYVNGKPASQVREELEKLTLSNEALTAQEKARCVQVIGKSSNDILRHLDSLNTQIVQFDEKVKQDAAIQAASMNASIARIQSGMSRASLPVQHFVAAAIVVVPITMIAWASYRIILWLMKKFA